MWTAYPSDALDFVSIDSVFIFATDIETSWKLNLDLIDLELGREFWVSPKVSLRPHVGLRIAYLKQSFDLQHKGGAFSQPVIEAGSSLNDFVDIDNDFKGVGVRAGLDSIWNLGCGFGIYGNFALSLIYGRFSIDHDEYVREASSPFSKTTIFQKDTSFRASRLATDLALGLQWAKLLCSCQYGITVSLGWEQHLFLNQNQMVAMTRETSQGYSKGFLRNFSYDQRSGDLAT